MRFLFRLDLSLHAGAEFFFGIWNFGTGHGPGCTNLRILNSERWGRNNFVEDV